MTLMWFIIFLVLLGIEFATVNLVTIWFVIGSLVAILLSFFLDSVVIQTTAFLVVSIISLILTRPLIKKFNSIQKAPTNSDRFIGKEGIVVKDIKDNEFGEVKVSGDVWTATSKKNIKEGTKVIVKDIEGVKLVVEVKEEN